MKNGETSLRDGEEMYGWAKALFPICRSLTGRGVRETFDYLRDLLPDLKTYEVASGTKAFDWTVPAEWNIEGAYVEHEDGTRIVDFANHNLHVVGYSEPVDMWLELGQLQPHLYSLPDQPDLIPYITSYYSRRWGFCLTHKQREQLKPGKYHAVIRSTLTQGSLTYGELILPGREQTEILLSTYICHPSMANNELSGPVVTTSLARWLMSRTDRRFTYRIIFIPETIGAIVYLSQHLAHLKEHLAAGFVITCVGDDRSYSFMPSRLGNTLADRVGRHVLDHHTNDYEHCSFLQRGSDERQYCAPGVDLPVVSIMRSRYGTFPEYHTSADDLSLITPTGLLGAQTAIRTALEILEANHRYRVNILCEPQLGSRGLRPTISTKESRSIVLDLMNVIAYCDGQHDLIQIAEKVGLSAAATLRLLEPILDAGLIDLLP